MVPIPPEALGYSTTGRRRRGSLPAALAVTSLASALLCVVPEKIGWRFSETCGFVLWYCTFAGLAAGIVARLLVTDETGKWVKYVALFGVILNAVAATILTILYIWSRTDSA